LNDLRKLALSDSFDTTIYDKYGTFSELLCFGQRPRWYPYQDLKSELPKPDLIKDVIMFQSENLDPKKWTLTDLLDPSLTNSKSLAILYWILSPSSSRGNATEP
jgi:hypothetical protein